MKARKLTLEGDELLTLEAERRAKHLPRVERRLTKSLAIEAGVTYSYAANIIAKRRREIEAKIKVDVPRET